MAGFYNDVFNNTLRAKFKKDILKKIEEESPRAPLYYIGTGRFITFEQFDDDRFTSVPRRSPSNITGNIFFFFCFFVF